MIATCPDQTKSTLVEELRLLGATQITPLYRAVECLCSEEVFYRVHLQVRTASRFFVVVKEFTAKSENMLFDQARRIRWEHLFSENMTYRVDGVVADRGSEYMRSNTASKKVREAIQLAFERSGRPQPRVELKEPKVVVIVFIHKGRAVISLDSTGKALHKRGFRGKDFHPAPLKETMAASVLTTLGYDGSQVLFDPMCGTGTFAIEAAYIAQKKAPLIHRKKGEFGFEWLKLFNRNLWRSTQDSVRDARDQSGAWQPIFASDIEARYVKNAQENAKKARVERDITFDSGSFFNRKPPAPSGLLVANLPYGERLHTQEEDEAFFRAVGDKLKSDYCGWKVGLLVSERSAFKFIGLRPNRKIRLMNGSIPCLLLVFEIYEGSRRKRASS